MDRVMELVNAVNDVLWHDKVLLFILGVGLLFTVWSGFCQWRALTHGVDVIRGKFDRRGDPGAINHFQALSTALSATVGLGNIAGVALAVSLGGPGAVFWMWVTGLVGMALKTTEVTQALMYRNTDDPQNPSGGAMWIARRGFAAMGPRLAIVGKVVAVIFCITLVISAVTGGNMFQAWNVADITFSYFGVDRIVSGVVMTVLTALVILGGIKRIGDVTGKLVPFMCGLYMLAGLVVILGDAERIPDMFRLIFLEAFNPTTAQGAFIGGAAGYTFLKGMQRALFSNEAGQGSSPIAHSAARTDEPVREGIVAGLEPFIDTLVVCTVTALVLLLSGEWNRAPDMVFSRTPAVVPAGAASDGTPLWTLEPSVVTGDERGAVIGQEVYAVVQADHDHAVGTDHHQLRGTFGRAADGSVQITWHPGGVASALKPELRSDGIYMAWKGATLTAKAFDRAFDGLGFWLVPIVAWLFALSTIISWSYYGEQGIRYIFGNAGIVPYRVVYCLLVLVSCTSFIRSEAELDVVSSLGTGVMLAANIPIMLVFGRQAMREYKAYLRKLDAGGFHPHAAPPLKDVAEGSTVD